MKLKTSMWRPFVNVDASQDLWVKHGIIAAKLDSGPVIDAHNVRRIVSRQRESGVWQESANRMLHHPDQNMVQVTHRLATALGGNSSGLGHLKPTTVSLKSLQS